MAGENNPAAGGGEIIDAQPPGPLAVATTSDAHPHTNISLDLSQEDGVGVRRVQVREKYHAGPLPSADTFRELAEVYPKAPQIIFDEYKAQGKHRREMEELALTTNSQLALRGQNRATIVGVAALAAAAAIGVAGHDLAAFGTVLAAIGGLCVVFLSGRRQQQRELSEKRDIKKEIKAGSPIEAVEGGNEESPLALPGDSAAPSNL